jgi:hypothetical protein
MWSAASGHLRSRRWLIFGATVLIVACASGVASRSTVEPSPPESAVAPTSTAAASTSTSTQETVARTSVPSDDATVAKFVASDLPSTGSCSLGSPPTGGQITFVVAGRLYAVGADGNVQCLADLEGRSPTWLSWSPDGDEVLIGPDLLLQADGTFSTTGYFADNTNVEWSAPTGKALIAPKAATGELIWRDAHEPTDRIDVSFADGVTSAAYHPAGKHIVAAGTGRDGLGPGVFVASNRGANAQRIGALDPGSTATEVAFDMSGDSVVFVHQHADGGSHVHRYVFSTGALLTLADLPDTTPTHLTVSPVDEGDVAWTQTYSTVNSSAHVLLADATTDAVVNSPAGEHVSDPIGWLPAHRLLVDVRPVGTPTPGPFELWEWAPSGMTQVIAGVTAAAARTIHGPYNELTIIPGSGFG